MLRFLHLLRVLLARPAGCRDAEVLSLFAAIINKLGRKMEKEVPRIFEAVFQVTLDMITKNFEVGFKSAGYRLTGTVVLSAPYTFQQLAEPECGSVKAAFHV